MNEQNENRRQFIVFIKYSRNGMKYVDVCLYALTNTVQLLGHNQHILPYIYRLLHVFVVKVVVIVVVWIFRNAENSIRKRLRRKGGEREKRLTVMMMNQIIHVYSISIERKHLSARYLIYVRVCVFVYKILHSFLPPLSM